MPAAAGRAQHLRARPPGNRADRTDRTYRQRMTSRKAAAGVGALNTLALLVPAVCAIDMGAPVLGGVLCGLAALAGWAGYDTVRAG